MIWKAGLTNCTPQGIVGSLMIHMACRLANCSEGTEAVSLLCDQLWKRDISMKGFVRAVLPGDANPGAVQAALYAQGLRYHNAKQRRGGLAPLSEPEAALRGLAREQRLSTYLDCYGGQILPSSSDRLREKLSAAAAGQRRARRSAERLVFLSTFLPQHQGLPRLFNAKEVSDLNASRPPEDQLELPTGLLNLCCTYYGLALFEIIFHLPRRGEDTYIPCLHLIGLGAAPVLHDPSRFYQKVSEKLEFRVGKGSIAGEVVHSAAFPKFVEEKPDDMSYGFRGFGLSLLRVSCQVQQTPVAETDPVDRTTFNQIFSQLTETGELAVERLAEGRDPQPCVGCDKEWIHEILRDQFNGRSFLDRSDFYDFVNMYRNQRFTFMRKIFSEVDQDHSQSVSLQEVVQLLGRRGITPVLSCVERIFREVTGESGLRDLTFEEFVKIYDVVQARAGFSEKPLVEFRPLTSAVLPDVFAGHDEITAITVGASIAGVGTRLGNALATDSDGFFVAAATGDGRIVVWPLGNGGEPWDTFALCAGGDDGRLILHRRTFLGGQTLLHSGEGQINQVRWRASLIAWGNEKGVKVYNTATSQKVTYVPRPQGGGRVTGLLWISDDQLAMSWSSAVKLAVILPAEGANLYAQVDQIVGLSIHRIHGLGLAGPGALSTLEVTGRSAFLKLQGPSGGLFHAVEVPFSRGAFHSHLFLQTGAPHLPMLAAGPRDLLMFQIRDLLEYAVQLLEEGNFDEAIRLANGGGEGIQGLRHIVCLKCLTPDVKDGNFESLVLFDRAGALPHLALQLPVPPKEQLPNEVYDDALRRLVHYPSALVAVLAYWPNDIFSTSELQAILHKDAPSFTSSTELSQDHVYRMK
eukprot:s3245_g5.t1